MFPKLVALENKIILYRQCPHSHRQEDNPACYLLNVRQSNFTLSNICLPLYNTVHIVHSIDCLFASMSSSCLHIFYRIRGILHEELGP